MRRNAAWVIGLALLLALAGAWLARYEPFNLSRSAELAPLRIGVINPSIGPFGAYGEPVRDGILMAIEEANRGGGIRGKKLEIVLEDDGGDPKNSVNAFTRLATVLKVPIVIGPLSSGASMATAPLADRYKVVQLSTLAGTIDLSQAGDYVFRIYPSSEVGSRFIANVAVHRFKAKRVAIFYPNNAFGVASRKFVTEVTQKEGAEIVAVETFKDGDRDFRTQLAKIAEATPQVIICSAYYEEGAQILIQAKQLGLNIPILGEDGWFGPIAQAAGDTLKNLYFANVAFGQEYKDNKKMQDFIMDFKNRFGRPPNSFSAAGYSAVQVVKQALEEGGDSAEKIKNILYKIDLETPFGRVRFDGNGDNVGAIYGLFQLNAENQPVLVR